MHHLADHFVRSHAPAGCRNNRLCQRNGRGRLDDRHGDLSDCCNCEHRWATRLLQEGGGHVLVDERDLWPQGQYVTTQLIVATDFLDKHPDVIEGLLRGLVSSIDAIAVDPAAAQKSTNAEIADVTGKPLSDKVIADAWKNLTFTVDPIASSLQQSAEDAESIGLLAAVDLSGIYDLTILNKVLVELGRSPVAGS